MKAVCYKLYENSKGICNSEFAINYKKTKEDFINGLKESYLFRCEIENVEPEIIEEDKYTITFVTEKFRDNSIMVTYKFEY